MCMSDPINDLGSIWYHLEALEILYCPNQFLSLDFFAVSYSKPALVDKTWVYFLYTNFFINQAMLETQHTIYVHTEHILVSFCNIGYKSMTFLLNSK